MTAVETRAFCGGAEFGDGLDWAKANAAQNDKAAKIVSIRDMNAPSAISNFAGARLAPKERARTWGTPIPSDYIKISMRLTGSN
jgi:hypothetical protein